MTIEVMRELPSIRIPHQQLLSTYSLAGRPLDQITLSEIPMGSHFGSFCELFYMWIQNTGTENNTIVMRQSVLCNRGRVAKWAL